MTRAIFRAGRLSYCGTVGKLCPLPVAPDRSFIILSHEADICLWPTYRYPLRRL